MKTATAVPSTEAAASCPPNVRYSLDTLSRSTIRIRPHENSVSPGSFVSRVRRCRVPRPETVTQYSMSSGS